MSGGLKGPLSRLQELEVGGSRPPYLLVMQCLVLDQAEVQLSNFIEVYVDKTVCQVCPRSRTRRLVIHFSFHIN